MTIADGTVLGTTQIVNNGPTDTHWNMVILGDGYQISEMQQYAADAQRTANAVLGTLPISSRRAVINVFRVDVASTDSGADDPTACGGSGAAPRTYFDATFCSNGLHRDLVADPNTAFSVATAQVPQWHMILMLVNSTIYGGSGGVIAVCSLAQGATNIAIHEMGHSLFGLADEYDSYLGCGIDIDRDHHPPMEPAQPNVTINPDRTTIKWHDLILPSTPMPTMVNPDCTQCNLRPSPVPDGTVGAFEGADQYHCGAFRPEYRCKMFDLNFPFCAVCRRKILQVLPTVVPNVREMFVERAMARLLAAGFDIAFSEPLGPGAWVSGQAPSGGTIVAYGSTVRLALSTGPMP